MRVVFWLVIAAILVWIFRNKTNRNPVAVDRRTARDQPEAMVQCRQCRVYFPASEALADSFGSVFCCEEHRSRHREN